VFDRFTEKARRVIFFARYEASRLGGEYVETEHILLALLREDTQLGAVLRSSGTTGEQIRGQVEVQATREPKASTSVDMPLSEEGRRVLLLAAEEADSLSDESIDMPHLVLALLRVQSSSTTILQQYGITHDTYRDAVGSPKMKEPRGALSGPMAALIRHLGFNLLVLDHSQRLKRKPWSRLEAVGHLVDLAAAHHLWLAQALAQPRLTAAEYPRDEWVTAERYADYSWRELVGLWTSLNRLIVHVLAAIPEEKLTMPCKIGIADPVPLSVLVARYVADCEDLLGQIMARLG
jgi:hypothetical protein